MKLLTLNIAVFEANNAKVSDYLKSEKPDIVSFQEVTRRTTTDVKLEYISIDNVDKGTKHLKHDFFAPSQIMDETRIKGFHGEEDFYFNFGGHLELGNYTKSKYKMTNAQSIFLEGNFSFSPLQRDWPNKQTRNIAVTDLEIEKGKTLRVINYHGIWTRDKQGNEKTLKACKEILQIAKDFKGDTIICGDFNLFPDTPSMKVFDKDFISLVNKYKIHTTRPTSNELSGGRNVVDYILVSKGIKVNEFRVIDNDVSDHLPLVLDFDL